jgi:NTP-dependent ternary system trypsin peptidase co-occuring protein
MDPETRIVAAQLPNGVVVQVQTVAARGEQDVAAHDFSFETVTKAIEGIVTALATTIQRVSPQKATVEFEVDFSVESGQLTALFVKGSGSGTLKISLEWDKPLPK